VTNLKELDGANQLLAQLEDLGNADYIPAMVKGAEVILEEMKTLTPVDTGALRDSERIEVVDDAVLLVAGDGERVDYAIFVEIGTYKMAAQPYMRPAIDTKGDEAMRVTADEVNKIMEATV
jgi:HK97 gp10 family phage protein